MGLLDRTKSPPPPPPPQASLLSTKTTACKNTNLKTSGNKKATYSFSSNLEVYIYFFLCVCWKFSFL